MQRSRPASVAYQRPPAAGLQRRLLRWFAGRWPLRYAARSFRGGAMSRAQDYPLGYTEHEARRLAEQGALLEELTAEVFRRAGLRAGMTVLDVGCGVGDVSLLAARLVGPKGAVLGIDRAASSVQTARGRATALGVAHARFEQADLVSFETDQSFDALIGRLVLLYLPDPAGTL